VRSGTLFIVKNTGVIPFTLQDDFISLDIQAGESVDLEAIFSHDQLYYSSLPPTGALWLAIANGLLDRRDNADTLTIPIPIAFYDPVWRYSPNEGQWQALVGTVPIPSSTNRYVTEQDFGIASSIQTNDDIPTTLYHIPVPLNCSMLIQSWVTSARTAGTSGNIGDCGNFIKIGTVKNIGNVLSLKIVESAYTFRDQITWLVFFDTDGTDVRVRVRGALNNVINWSGKTRTQVQTF
jgi:hypothetical protein